MRKQVIILLLSTISVFATGQNMPSLLSGKNINATFSILAYDEDNKEWGIAVATNNIYVGNSTIYIEPGVGAFSVIAETNPDYAINGFNKLKEGATIAEAILFTKEQDEESHFRQISGIDNKGNVFAFTGEALNYWNGKSGHILKDKFVVMGNQLDDFVLERMSVAFENTKGTLAERLLSSLMEGQIAGGQITGKQSAALMVKGLNNEWFNQIDLRVDNSQQPFKELKTLLNYHYGRIRLNQSIYAIEYGNERRAKEKLNEAEKLLEGWNGMYSKIAFVNSLMGDEEKSIFWIQKALLENSNWKVNLPAFYYLRNNEKLSQIIDPTSFSPKDWENAVSMLTRLKRTNEAISLSNEVLSKGIQSSYLYYLLGESYYKIGNNVEAKNKLTKALKIDPANKEAQLMLNEIENK